MLFVPDLPLDDGRAPYGARGLKFHDKDVNEDGTPVAPRMGRVD